MISELISEMELLNLDPDLKHEPTPKGVPGATSRAPMRNA